MILRLLFEARVALRASNRSLGSQVFRAQVYKGTVPRLLLGTVVRIQSGMVFNVHLGIEPIMQVYEQVPRLVA